MPIPLSIHRSLRRTTSAATKNPIEVAPLKQKNLLIYWIAIANAVRRESFDNKM